MAQIVTCSYCQQRARLTNGKAIYPHRPDLWDKWFWLCGPCEAYVGCHKGGDGTKPLGRLANAELRAAKGQAHAAFDRLWQLWPPREGERRRVYTWLANKLGIDRKHCHIGEFDVETCRRVISICQEHGEELLP
jgi:hypothetical protein